MSRLQKAISRIQRRESPRSIGFGAQSREQPRAMLLGVLAANATAARSALEAGADFAILRTSSARSAGTELKPLGGNESIVGAWLDRIDDAAGAALADSGCDFAVCSLEGTDASAVDVERMGQVALVPLGIDDTTLRALGPINLDALLVEPGEGPMSLASQLQLVRLASFASTPLMLTIAPGTAAAELRVLRDSGGVAVLLPVGATAAQLAALADQLRAVPPRKPRREGGEMALVPAITPAPHPEEIEEPDEDE